jgi:hypothetical protein
MYTNSVRTVQGRHYVSAARINLLVLFRKKVAVYFENHAKQTHHVS